MDPPQGGQKVPKNGLFLGVSKKPFSSTFFDTFLVSLYLTFVTEKQEIEEIVSGRRN